jgi:hypothetical protein
MPPLWLPLMTMLLQRCIGSMGGARLKVRGMIGLECLLDRAGGWLLGREADSFAGQVLDRNCQVIHAKAMLPCAGAPAAVLASLEGEAVGLVLEGAALRLAAGAGERALAALLVLLEFNWFSPEGECSGERSGACCFLLWPGVACTTLPPPTLFLASPHLSTSTEPAALHASACRLA